MRGPTRAALPLLVACLVLAPGCAKRAETEAPDLRLYVFDCGRIETEDVADFSLAREEVAELTLFVPCYLVEHPDGRLLWDAGLDPATADAEAPVAVGGGYWLELDTPLDAQLAELGLTPADVEIVAFSHMHFDHVGHANLFAASTLLIQRPEYEAAFAPEPSIPYTDRSLYSALDASEKRLLDGDHDVFGDGRVRILSTPGHTPGHQVLFVDLERTGPLVLSGDLYHFPANRNLRRVPTFNVDREQTLASMDRVERFLSESGATLWIEHDIELARGLRKAPGFYD